MKTYDDIVTVGAMRILLWAPPGVGKTALMATFPGLAVIDTDNGMKTVKGKWFLANRKKPDLIGFEPFDNDVDRYGVYKDTKGFWKAIDFVNEMLKKPEVQTIGLDSLSTFQELAMHVGIDAAQTGKRSKTKELANTSHVLLPTQADFGAEMNVLTQFMNQLIKSQKNIICIAHEKEVLSESGSLIRREPYLIGTAVRAMVAKWFDEVWYLDVNNKGERVLKTQQTNIFKVNKSRLGVEDGLVDPTYEKIVKSLAA